MEITRQDLIETFLAESEEGLSVMEEALTVLEREPEDEESLAEIFRAAHTLKGNAVSFGFTAVSELAHVVEDLLDRLREKSLGVTEELITLLLRSVDVFREMVPKAAADEDAELPAARALKEELAAFTTETEHTTAPATETPVEHEPVKSMVPETDATERRAKSIRVDLDRLDRLLNLTGEVCIARGQITQMLENRQLTQEAILESHRESDLLYMDLQELVMKLRMVPVGPMFRHQIRVVRDLARTHGKKARLTIDGEDVEVDTSVMEHLRDPLTHMIRNALDHGIETPEVRAAARKDPSGLIQLRAYHDAGSIVIELEDDGAGLDRERIRKKASAEGLRAKAESLSDEETDQLIFEPGFSTAERVTDLSGRGVGMDVVRRNIETLRGTVSVVSRKGHGTTLSIRLPLTLAIIEGFQVGIGEEIYILPIEAVVETLAFDERELTSDTGRGVLSLRGKTLPYVRLRELLGQDGTSPSRESIVVVRSEGAEAGIVVDALLGQAQTVIKPLGKFLQGLSGISGSAILGSGEVAFILDVPALLRRESELEAVER